MDVYNENLNNNLNIYYRLRGYGPESKIILTNKTVVTNLDTTVSNKTEQVYGGSYYGNSRTVS